MGETHLVDFEPCFCVYLSGSCSHGDLGDCMTGLFERLIESEPEAELIEAPRVYYTSWTTEGVTIEAAFPVDPATVEGKAESKTYPGGKALVAVHNGSYGTLHETWKFLWQEFEKQGLKQAGSCWDSYITDPEEEPDPSLWITQLYIPIAE